MKRLILVLAAFALLSIEAVGAPSTRQVLQDFNYIGRWANTCGQPVSDENGTLEVVVTPSGAIEHRYDFGNGRGEVNTIVDAQRTGPEELTLKYQIRGLERTQVIMRKGNVIRTMHLIRTDGSYITKDGIIIQPNVPTRSLTRCGDRTSNAADLRLPRSKFTGSSN